MGGRTLRRGLAGATCGALLALVAQPALAASDARPWMNASLAPDARAGLVLARMSQDEKFALMAGACDPHGHTGFVAGIPRLGIPDLYLNDGPVGVHEE